jgi:hypothetical protein
VFTSARALEAMSVVLPSESIDAINESWLISALYEIAGYLDRNPSRSLGKAVLAVLVELERELNERFEFKADVADVLGILQQFPAALSELCAVYEYGGQKYKRGNYRKGAPLTSYLDSALRHILSYASGQTYDIESGLHHLGHALWNLWVAMDLPGLRDDRLPAVEDFFLEETFYPEDSVGVWSDAS